MTANFSFRMNTRWSHQKFFSELGSITQTSTNLAEFAWISLKINGHLLFRSDQFSFQSKHWCQPQIWMILSIKRLQISGSLTLKVLLKKQKNGLFSMPITERPYAYEEYNSWIVQDNRLILPWLIILIRQLNHLYYKVHN